MTDAGLTRERGRSSANDQPHSKGDDQEYEKHSATAGRTEPSCPNTRLEWALRYARELGWCVFPGTKDARRGKVPLVKWGKGRERFAPDLDLRLFAASRDPELIRAWWTRWPNAEIGVDTGRSGLIVLDVDVKAGKQGEAALDWITTLFGNLPTTLEQVTPSGGRQLLFNSDTLCRSSVGADGLDVRSKGGMIFVPSGGDDRRWKDIGIPVSLAPDWMPGALGVPAQATAPGASETTGLWTPDDLEEALRQLDVVAFAEHDDWRTLMMAAHEATAGEGEDAFVEWSLGDGRYCEDEHLIRYRWHSLNAGQAGGITHRTIFDRLANPAFRSEHYDPDWRPRWERPGHDPENDFDEVADDANARWPVGTRFLSFDDLMSLPDPEWLVHGLIPLRGIGSLYGPSGGLKSFLAFHLGCCVALGREALPGHPCKRADVYYIAAEDGAGFKLRGLAWTKHFGDRPVRFAMQNGSTYLNKAGEAKALAEFINQNTPRADEKLVIVDTLSANFDGKENTDDAAGFVRALQDIVRGTGGNTTVLFIHHIGKDGSKGERGHSSIRANVDFSVYQELVGDVRSGYVAVRVQKLRNASTGAEIKLKPTAVEVSPDASFKDSLILLPYSDAAADQDFLDDEPERPQGRQRIKADEIIAAARALDGAPLKDLVATLKTTSGASDAAIRRRINEVLRPGVPMETSDGSLWVERIDPRKNNSGLVVRFQRHGSG